MREAGSVANSIHRVSMGSKVRLPEATWKRGVIQAQVPSVLWARGGAGTWLPLHGCSEWMVGGLPSSINVVSCTGLSPPNDEDDVFHVTGILHPTPPPATYTPFKGCRVYHLHLSLLLGQVTWRLDFFQRSVQVWVIPRSLGKAPGWVSIRSDTIHRYWSTHHEKGQGAKQENLHFFHWGKLVATFHGRLSQFHRDQTRLPSDLWSLETQDRE